MKVKDLILELQKIQNQDAEINILGNVGYPDDEETDLYFDYIELWEDGDSSITLFVGLTDNTIDNLLDQQRKIDNN